MAILLLHWHSDLDKIHIGIKHGYKLWELMPCIIVERNFPVRMGAAVITLPATEASSISIAQVNSKSI